MRSSSPAMSVLSFCSCSHASRLISHSKALGPVSLSFLYACACAVIESTALGLYSSSWQQGIYCTLGRVYNRNVAIAVLADGEYGIASAAVAGVMLHVHKTESRYSVKHGHGWNLYRD